MADLTSDIQLQTGGGTLAVTVRADEASVISGVKCYLFSAGGAYLNQSATTDASGLVTFDVADGSYKIRVYYLGYQYWSDALNSSEILSTTVTIPHEEVGVAVTGSNAVTVDQLAGVRCYLFTAAGSYTGITTVSDQLGVAHFNVPMNLYKVRADYMGEKYWSEEFDWFDTIIDIPHGDIALIVTEDNYPVSGATVYLFTEAGTYLSINGKTDENGEVVFSVPAASYKLRADVNGGKFWSSVVNVLGYQENTADIAIENSAAIGINNPRPARYDGEPPLYMPMVASLTLPGGILVESTAEISLGSDARPFWFIADHLGTAQMIADVDGKVVWQGEYRPFGEVEVVVDELENLFRFPGQVLDVENGLYYNWHRFYDPETGRYISADPIGLAGGMNLYAYVGGDPVNWGDPWGLKINYSKLTEKQKKLVLSWIEILKECAKCDKEFEERLDEVLNGSYELYIFFREGAYPAGFEPPLYPDHVRFDPYMENHEESKATYGEAWSWSKFFRIDKTPYREGHYTGPDLLAHELVGHGYDKTQRDPYKHQSTAIRLANLVRKCMGNKQPQRSRNDP